MNNYDDLHIEDFETVDLPPEIDAMIEQKIQEAEEDIEKARVVNK